MTGNLSIPDNIERSNSYQHIQGSMLLNLNKISFEIKISHSEYRLMGTLIGLWNKNQGMAFPTIDYLANICKMGKSTIIKNLEALVRLGLLIVIKTPGKRNNYYFSNLILDNTGTPHVELHSSTHAKLRMIKQIKNKTNKEQTSCSKTIDNNPNKPTNDDVLNNNTDKQDYKKALAVLKSWSFIGAEFVIKQHGVEKINKLIEIVKTAKPTNHGAYLRNLLNNSKTMLPITSDTINNNNFYKLESRNVEVKRIKKCEALEHIKTIQKINELKPTKNEILEKIMLENPQEGDFLKLLWKL